MKQEAKELVAMYVVTFVVTLAACVLILQLYGCGNSATEVEDCHPFDAPCWYVDSAHVTR